jgi:hypothetical protein
MPWKIAKHIIGTYLAAVMQQTIMYFDIKLNMNIPKPTRGNGP